MSLLLRSSEWWNSYVTLRVLVSPSCNERVLQIVVAGRHAKNGNGILTLIKSNFLVVGAFLKRGTHCVIGVFHSSDQQQQKMAPHWCWIFDVPGILMTSRPSVWTGRHGSPLFSSVNRCHVIIFPYWCVQQQSFAKWGMWRSLLPT